MSSNCPILTIGTGHKLVLWNLLLSSDSDWEYFRAKYIPETDQTEHYRGKNLTKKGWTKLSLI